MRVIESMNERVTAVRADRYSISIKRYGEKKGRQGGLNEKNRGCTTERSHACSCV